MATNEWIFDVSSEDFDARVVETSMACPVLVDFWAEWCAPCLQLAPVLEQIIHQEQGALLLARVEVDDNMKLAGRWKVRGFPTVVLIDRGKELGRFSGARSVQQVRQFLAGHLHGRGSTVG